MNVMGIHNGSSFYLTSIYNDTSNTAATLASLIQPIIQDMLNRHIRIVAIAADNEAVNGAMIRILTASFPWLVHIPCAAHTIQLVVNELLKHPSIKPFVDSASLLIEQFASSKAARQELRRQCLSLKKNAAHRLKRIVPTRLNTTLFALERLLLLKPQIQYTLTLHNMPAPDSIFWDTIKLLVDILKPFQVTTDLVQTDYVTLSAVAQSHSILIDTIHKHVITETPYKEAMITCLNSIDHHWSRHINTDAVEAVKYFTALDGRPLKTPIKEFILTWAPKYLIQFHLTPFTPTQDIAAALQQQIMAFETSTSPFHNKSIVLDRFTKTDAI